MANGLRFRRTITLCVILLTLFRVTVFSQDGEIFQGTHQRNETVPIVFAFAAIRQDGVTVAVAEKIDPDAVLLTELSDLVQADAERFRSNLTGLVFQDVSVFVVSLDDQGTIQSEGAALYCSADDIRSGAYRADFLTAMFGLDSRWLGIGLMGWLDEIETGGETVPAWLEENPVRLNVWDGRFLAGLNRPEEIDFAVKTAALLVRELIKDYGVTAVQELPPTLRGEICRSLGLTDCLSPETEARLNSFQVKPSVEDSVEILTPRIRYLIRINDGYFENASDLERFLLRNESGIESVLATLSDSLSPENAAWITENLAGASCRIEYDSPRSAASPVGNEITISRLAGFQRELAQLMIQSHRKPYTAIYEGIGVYFDLALFPESFFSNWIFYPPADQPADPALTLDPGAKACLVENRCSETDRPSALRQLFEAIRNAARSENDDVRGVFYGLNQPLKSVRLYENVDEPGKERTFIECAMAVAELVDRFGLDRVADYLRTGESFEDAFGLGFAEFLEGME